MLNFWHICAVYILSNSRISKVAQTVPGPQTTIERLKIHNKDSKYDILSKSGKNHDISTFPDLSFDDPKTKNIMNLSKMFEDVGTHLF